MRLGEEGLVDIFPQHATVVSRISIGAARQAHFLRRSIELEVVATLAARADAALAGRLRAVIERQRRAMDGDDYAAFIAADHDFHRAMYEAAEVAELWPLVRRASGHVDRLRRLHLPAAGKAQAVLRDHGRIVDAIGRGDAEGARQCLREHLSGTLGQAEEIRARFPDHVAD